MQVKVAKHFVGAPSAEYADDVGVDLGAKTARRHRAVTSEGRKPSDGPSTL